MGAGVRLALAARLPQLVLVVEVLLSAFSQAADEGLTDPGSSEAAAAAAKSVHSAAADEVRTALGALRGSGASNGLKTALQSARQRVAKQEQDDAPCACDVGAAQECKCHKSCSEDEQIDLCQQQLGPCACEHDEASALCDCSGYCHNTQHRQWACEDTEGCQWSGMWCEPETNLLGDSAPQLDDSASAVSNDEIPSDEDMGDQL
eukprot:TRINITY_DN45622_c0_g1_i1.p2 TRINITY_DN45622_c0_g1~~TRINITY_DN45622_c0_g1_i1.p2  ORF type:complete len:205 (-),score=67.50 TRINITY_DN45622_c0_g1_i1:106-720(-)